VTGRRVDPHVRPASRPRPAPPLPGVRRRARRPRVAGARVPRGLVRPRRRAVGERDRAAAPLGAQAPRARHHGAPGAAGPGPVPFNLRLLAELLAVTQMPESALRDIDTQVGLLDAYWRERVLRPPAQADARERLLHRVCEAMIAGRRLTIPRAELRAGDVDLTSLHPLLHDHVLVERPLPSGEADRERLGRDARARGRRWPAGARPHRRPGRRRRARPRGRRPRPAPCRARHRRHRRRQQRRRARRRRADGLRDARGADGGGVAVARVRRGGSRSASRPPAPGSRARCSGPSWTTAPTPRPMRSTRSARRRASSCAGPGMRTWKPSPSPASRPSARRSRRPRGSARRCYAASWTRRGWPSAATARCRA